MIGKNLSKFSPYSKMYLVSPGIYEKMLKCIDEGDRCATEALNSTEVYKEEKRPSEQVLEEMYKEEMNEPPQPELLQDNIPLTNIVEPAPIIPNYGPNVVPLHDTQERPPKEVTAIANPARKALDLFDEVEGSMPITPIKPLFKRPVLPDKRFHCDLCQSSYTRKFDLKRHVRDRHSDDDLGEIINKSAAQFETWGDEAEKETTDLLEESVPVKKKKTAKIKSDKEPKSITKTHATRSSIAKGQTGSGSFPSWK